MCYFFSLSYSWQVGTFSGPFGLFSLHHVIVLKKYIHIFSHQQKKKFIYKSGLSWYFLLIPINTVLPASWSSCWLLNWPLDNSLWLFLNGKRDREFRIDKGRCWLGYSFFLIYLFHLDLLRSSNSSNETSKSGSLILIEDVSIALLLFYKIYLIA